MLLHPNITHCDLRIYGFSSTILFSSLMVCLCYIIAETYVRLWPNRKIYSYEKYPGTWVLELALFCVMPFIFRSVISEWKKFSAQNFTVFLKMLLVMQRNVMHLQMIWKIWTVKYEYLHICNELLEENTRHL